MIIELPARPHIVAPLRIANGNFRRQQSAQPMTPASAQKRMMLISRAGSANTDRLTGVATMDGHVMRGSPGWQYFSVSVRCKCPLGNIQTLSDKIPEHPEFGAAR